MSSFMIEKVVRTIAYISFPYIALVKSYISATRHYLLIKYCTTQQNVCGKKAKVLKGLLTTHELVD